MGGDGGLGGGDLQREDLVDGEVLRGEDSVEAFERKRTFAIEEVRDMRLLEACLLGEAAAGEGAALDAAQEFDAEEFVQVLKVHERRVSLANHIIRQDEDKAKALLYAIRFDAKPLEDDDLRGLVA